jgi:hypothetical protein
MASAYGDEISIDNSEIEGLAEILDKFPIEVQNRMLQKSLEQGAIVVRQAVMEAAPVRVDEKTSGSNSLPPGYVKADIRIAPRRSGRGWLIGGSKATAYVIRWLELGHMMVHGGKRARSGGRMINRGGIVSTEHVPAHPFLRPAFDASWKHGLNAIYAELVRQMDDYWKQTVRRMKKSA